MVIRRLAVLAALLATTAFAAPARAAGSGDDVFRFFQEEREVTTVLRHPASADRAPLAVDVITAEDIKASGAINLWDLLRFRVGMDVLEGRSQDGTDRAVVSVRGMPRDSVAELQVLVDGRSVYSPIDGGVLWEHIPVQLQDIERIEIVRGPNAALYGSNAGLGVINIMTRRPAKPFEASATALGGSLNTRLGQAAVEISSRAWGLRLSASDRAQNGFPLASGAGTGNDWLHEQKASFRSWVQPEEATTIELLAGVSRNIQGEVVDPQPQAHGLNHFQTVRLTHEFENSSTLDARVSRTEDVTVVAPDPNQSVAEQNTRYWQYDSEAFHSVPWWDGRFRTTYGIQWKYAASRSNFLYGPDAGDVTNRVVRGFLHQEVRVTDSLSVMGGMSHETQNVGGYHKDFQVATLWSPLEDQSLRASYSRADTMPQLEHRYVNLSFPLTTPPDPNVMGALVGGADLRPSPLTDYEIGWNGRFLDKALGVELTGFYMYVQDHLNLDVANGPSPFYNLAFDNTNTVQLRGLEAELKYRFGPGRSVFANFTRETVTDQDHHDLYIRTTPKNKVNLGFDWALPAGLRASANAGYKDNYIADSNTSYSQDFVRAFWRLDARLGWTVSPGLELFVSGQNLLFKSHREFVDGLAVPRTIYGGATLRY